MASLLSQRKLVHVLFYASHGEPWTTRPEEVAAGRPEYPAGPSYARAAGALSDRDFTVAAATDGALTDDRLAETDVLVIAHPAGAPRERTTGDGPPRFSNDEVRAIQQFVARGGGLVVLGGAGEAASGRDLDDVLAPFGIRVEPVTVFGSGGEQGPAGGVTTRVAASAPRGLLHLVDDVRLGGAGMLVVDERAAVVLESGEDADPPLAPLLASASYGEGRVVVVADADLFGDAAIGTRDHERLWLNVAYWVAKAAFSVEPAPIVSAARLDPAWRRLKDETNALRRLQGPKGEVDPATHDLADVRAHVDAMIASIAALAGRFPHEQDYLERLQVDLRDWVDSGCAKPDFTASLALFRPEQHRRDGIEHLVVFPMYTPNGSPDTRYEALIVRTPWPEFIDRLERERYDNDKFVPVQLVDHTDGYDSECAVLFPETVSVAGRPTNNFGGIFCDRESVRFRRSLAKGSELLQIDLPPDAEALAASPELALETYILWDLIHDSWHSHGDLPFDPFMIRQRLPYWMYSLEELRVDLSSYVDAGRLAREGFPFARYVQYAVLFDRILRFPITGNRVRNYDGLGGQLLFAYLHKNGVLRWTDNRLLIDWARVEDAVTALRGEVETMYREGIDLSKVSYWISAHDLMARYVRPNVNSAWQRERRVYSDEADARAWIDRVLDDEFPLSMFYEQFKKKLADDAAATAPAAPATGGAPPRRGSSRTLRSSA